MKRLYCSQKLHEYWRFYCGGAGLIKIHLDVCRKNIFSPARGPVFENFCKPPQANEQLGEFFFEMIGK